LGIKEERSEEKGWAGGESPVEEAMRNTTSVVVARLHVRSSRNGPDLFIKDTRIVGWGGQFMHPLCFQGLKEKRDEPRGGMK